MKKTILLPLLVSLIGCNNANQSNDSSIFSSTLIDHSYDEVIDKMIEWNDLFLVNQNNYFAYIFSKTCSHCNNIKNEVIDYALTVTNFYFINFTSDIPIVTNTEPTLNQSDVKHMGILGTPTLIEIYNHTSIMNIAGEYEIVKNLAKLR